MPGRLLINGRYRSQSVWAREWGRKCPIRRPEGQPLKPAQSYRVCAADAEGKGFMGLDHRDAQVQGLWGERGARHRSRNRRTNPRPAKTGLDDRYCTDNPNQGPN